MFWTVIFQLMCYFERHWELWGTGLLEERSGPAEAVVYTCLEGAFSAVGSSSGSHTLCCSRWSHFSFLPQHRVLWHLQFYMLLCFLPTHNQKSRWLNFKWLPEHRNEAALCWPSPWGNRVPEIKNEPLLGLVRKAEHRDGLQKVSLCVTHDARAPGKPESGTTLPRGPGMLVWFGCLYLKEEWHITE